MNVELSVLRLLLKKELYQKYNGLLDRRHIAETFRELSYLYKVVDHLHENAVIDLTPDDVELAFWLQYPDAKPDLYKGLLADFRAVDVSEQVAEHLFEGMARRKALLSLSEAAYKATQGIASLQDVLTLVEGLKAPAVTSVEIESVSTDLEGLLNNVVRKPGLRWRLDCLNKSLGSLRKGDFGFVFARPETGKTTFLTSEVSAMLDTAERPILWFNNEEQGEKVMIRFFQAYFGVALEQLLGNTRQYKRLFNEQVGGNFILVDDAGIDRNRIERIIDKVQPSLIVYDQIDKIKGFKADRDDLLLGAIYQWARELAKTYAPTIGVCQADGTGEGQKWLTMANVANAKTAKQAEADFIIGLGKTHDAATENSRYINLSKNKLLGDEDSISTLRHGRLEVVIQPELGRYKDVIQYG